MLFEKTLTESICRLILLAVISAGAFSLFNGCALRNADETKAPETFQTATSIETASRESEVSDIPTIRREELSEESHPISPEAVEWIELYESRHGIGSTDEVIMSIYEIDKFNAKIVNDCTSVVDILQIPKTMNGSEVKEKILRYTMPNGDKYDRRGEHISINVRDQIISNCNIKGIGETVSVRSAVITSRCNLKSFPTELDFYDYGDRHYSRIQETELITGFPVWVLHTSTDEKFLFVQSYNYSGWIAANCAAFADEEEFKFFASPESFVTILKPYIIVADTRLDMGTILPYVSEDSDVYNVQIPIRQDDGSLGFSEASIVKSDSIFGYLPYTMKNYYNQAFAYLGTYYGWGGADGGVDCSGFLCAVFRTFGIYIPRNTGEQSQYSGTIHSLEALSSIEASAVLEQIYVPAAIHRKGHVMLYLGMKDGAHYVIHAPQGGEQVTVMKLSLPGNLISANTIIGNVD